MQPHLRVVADAKEASALEPLLQSGYRYALSLAHDTSEAEDLLQDACMAVVRAGSKWNKPYLFAVIRNRFIDRYRRNKKILFVSLDAGAVEEELDGGDDLPDFIERENLSSALGALRVEEREALFLAFVEGYTAQQIAALTSRPRNTVLSLLHRSKLKLRGMLRREQHHE